MKDTLNRRKILKLSSASSVPVLSGGVGRVAANNDVEDIKEEYDEMQDVKNEYDELAGAVLTELYERDLIESPTTDAIDVLNEDINPFSTTDVAFRPSDEGSQEPVETIAAVAENTDQRRLTVNVEPGRERSYAFNRQGTDVEIISPQSFCEGDPGEGSIECGLQCDCSACTADYTAWFVYPYPDDPGCEDSEYYGCGQGSCSSLDFCC